VEANWSERDSRREFVDVSSVWWGGGAAAAVEDKSPMTPAMRLVLV
jgi:hypothetical protein